MRRTVGLIGSADLDKIGLGLWDLAVDGWFDFEVWESKGEPDAAPPVFHRFARRIRKAVMPVSGSLQIRGTLVP